MKRQRSNDINQSQRELHNELKLKLSQGLTRERIDDLKTTLEGDVGSGVLEKATTAKELLDIMVNRGIFRLGDYTELKKRLNQTTLCHPLVQIITDYEGYINEAGSISSPAQTPGSATSTTSSLSWPQGSPKRQRSLQYQQSLSPGSDDGMVLDDWMKYETDDRRSKGFVFILNNFTKEREGTDVDEELLKAFFKDELKYKVRVARDCSQDALKKQLDAVQCWLNNDDEDDCFNRFLCFILSHGKKEGIKTCKSPMEHDGGFMAVEDIVSYFKADKVKAMAGKPKAFFIQACRGSDYQSYVSDDEPVQDENIETLVPDDVPGFTTPVDADILIAHATTPGYVSWRCKQMGSWFIQKCVQVFRKYHRDHDLLDMLTIVNHKVSQKRTNKGVSQMPHIESTFRKRMYLE